MCLSSFSAHVSQYGDGVPLRDGNPPGNIPHAPSVVPISCYVISSTGCIWFVSDHLTSSANIELVNNTTGMASHNNIIITSIPESVQLSGPGEYALVITLQSGAIFYGEFIL